MNEREGKMMGRTPSFPIAADKSIKYELFQALTFVSEWE